METLVSKSLMACLLVAFLGAHASAGDRNEKAADRPYSGIGKRDPFKSSYRTPPPKARRQPGPCEKFDLDRLELVAVVAKTSKPTAMFQTPEGTQYILVEGSRIGRNNGVVTRIMERGVLVEEKIFDPVTRKLRTSRKLVEIEKKPASLDKPRNHPWAALWKKG